MGGGGSLMVATLCEKWAIIFASPALSKQFYPSREAHFAVFISLATNKLPLCRCGCELLWRLSHALLLIIPLSTGPLNSPFHLAGYNFHENTTHSNVLDNGKRHRLGCNTVAALLTDFYQLLLLIVKKQFVTRLFLFVCLF
jgi:hypothetical protein